MPGGQGLPGARTGFPGVGWVFPGSDGGAIFRRRGGCDGFCEVCGAFGRLSLRKTPAEAGVRDAACGLRTEGPASARGDSSGGYGLRLAPGPVPGSVGTDSGLFPKPVPIPGSIGPRVLFPGPVPGLGPTASRSGPLLLANRADDARRIARHNGVGRDVVRDHRTGPHDGVLTDGDPRKHHRAGPYPGVAADENRPPVDVVAQLGLLGMVLGDEVDVGADEDPLLKGDAAAVHEGASVVDEDAPAEADELSEVGVERGNDPYRVVELLAGQLAQGGAHLGGGAVGGVEFAGDAHAAQQRLVEAGIFGVAVEDELARFHAFEDVCHGIRMSGDGSDGAKIALCALRGMTGIPVCATPIPAGAIAGSGTELQGKEEGGGAAVRDSFIIRSQGGVDGAGVADGPGEAEGVVPHRPWAFGITDGEGG